MMIERADMMRVTSGERHRRTSGFTLIEVMMALLIMVLLTAIVANGIPVAYQTYLKTVKTANAQVALSTTITELRDELGVASTESGFEPTSGTGTIDFCSNGFKRQIRNPNAAAGENGLMIGAYETMRSTTAPSKFVPLVPKEAIAGSERNDEKLIVTSDSIEYADNVFTITNLRVEDGNNPGAVLATAGVEDDSGDMVFKIRTVQIG